MIVSRRGYLEAKHPENGERYRDGIIYIAPPDQHIMLGRDGTIRVVRGPRENRHRPAVDPLFRSAAVAVGPDLIAVVLTGSLDDGTAGMIAVQRAGGTTIVQDPDDALYSSMPRSVVEPDFVLPLRDMPAKLVELVAQKPRKRRESRADLQRMEIEKRITAMDGETLQEDDRPGEPSAFSCPACGGVLWELQDGELTRFRCRVGHAFSPETMLAAQTEELERALFSALKTLEESARLSRRLAAAEKTRGHQWMADRFAERETDARERADAIRRFLLRDTGTTPVETGAEQMQ